METNEYKKECVAMLLAGGRGERLKGLTANIAKPAVTFGGKYRIIDFTLSNCVHSGIDTVGVLTQYLPMFLHDYIGKGQAWDLDTLFGGVHMLPPFSRGSRSDWYTGTANSVYQNCQFIEYYDPEYVLVLSGDHVYKMDYSLMLDAHKENRADVTIAVMQVPIEEASRYGIMNVDEDDRIYEFEEKPRHPKSTLASMGIYIFNWQLLREHLTRDDKNDESAHDFGKNVLPQMLEDGLRMFAYRFDGYWKDVGTLTSLWEANMDMIDYLNLGRPEWLTMSRTYGRPPQYIGPEGCVRNSLVTSGCRIEGSVEHSVLSSGVVVEPGAVVRDSVVMANTIIGRGAQVNYAILDESSVVEPNAEIGTPYGDGAPLTVMSDGELLVEPAPVSTIIASPPKQAVLVGQRR